MTDLPTARPAEPLMQAGARSPLPLPGQDPGVGLTLRILTPNLVCGQIPLAFPVLSVVLNLPNAVAL